MFKTLTEFGFFGGNKFKCLNLFRLIFKTVLRGTRGSDGGKLVTGDKTENTD